MTLQDLQQMTLLELFEVCDTDPQHIATHQLPADPEAWMRRVMDEATDALDWDNQIAELRAG